jgi:uncharacterized peroxidase-related enzyme
MALIPYPDLDSIPAAVRDHIEHFASDHGRPTLLRWMLAWSPPASAAVDALYHPVFTTGRLERRLKEMLFVAASEQRGCFYCMGGHSRLLVHTFGYTQEQVEQMRTGSEADGLDERERALVVLAKRVADDDHQVAEADIAAVREHGWDDDDIVEAITAAAQSMWTNTIAQSLHLEDDVTPENGFDDYF